MGVDLRVHTFFLLLLGICMISPGTSEVPVWRGIALWLLLLSAVLVREFARGLVATYCGLQVRSVLMLPTGGLFSFANPDSTERAASGQTQLALAFAGPFANLAFAGTVAALIVGAAPLVGLNHYPLVTPMHLMRSTVWLNVFLALLNFVPAYPLDAGRLLRNRFRNNLQGQRSEAQAARAASGFGQIIGLAAVLGGVALLVLHAADSSISAWLVLTGLFIFVGGQLEDQGNVFQSVVDTVTMRDVMLTEFSTMSPSDTLDDALFKAVHSLQDEFPVVRGPDLVGIVSRQNIVDALRSEGNGYVQSVMSRGYQVAQPDDSLGSMIRRMSGGRMSLVPVAEGERIIGVVTLQNLMHSMGLLAEQRRLRRH